MRQSYFEHNRESAMRVKRFANKLKKTLYGMYIPHNVSGCQTSPSRYFHLISMEYKDKIIRISDHQSSNPFYHTSNVYNVVIRNEVDDTWVENKLTDIKNWLKGGMNNEDENIYSKR